MACGQRLRSIDKFAQPVNDEETTSPLGGVLTITGHLLVVAYFVFSLIVMLTSDRLTSVSSVEQFPTAEADAFTMSNVRCIAASGCWVRRMARAQCAYYAQNEYFSAEDRTLFYVADPVDHLSVVWQSCNNGGTTNFGVSYEFTTLTNQFKGTTQTVSAGESGDTQSYKIYRGSTIMNLARTKGWTSDPYDVQTFSGVVASTDGTPDSTQNLCCNLPTVTNSAGSSITNTLSGQCAQTTTCNAANINKYYQVRLSTMPTYAETVVKNPWIILLEKTGGIAAVIELTFALILTVYRKMCMSSADEDIVIPAERESEVPDLEELEKNQEIRMSQWAHRGEPQPA